MQITRKINFVGLLLLNILFFSDCKKIEKFDTPHVLFGLRSHGIPLFLDTKDLEPAYKISFEDGPISVVGRFKTKIKKDAEEVLFVEIKCLPKFDKCKNGTGFLKASGADNEKIFTKSEYESRFNEKRDRHYDFIDGIIIPETESNDFKESWLFFKKPSAVSMVLNETALLLRVGQINPGSERMAILNDLILLSQFASNPKGLTDTERFTILKNKYSSLFKIKGNQPFSIKGLNETLLNKIKNMYVEEEKRLISELNLLPTKSFFYLDSYKPLEQSPYLIEKIFPHILKDRIFLKIIKQNPYSYNHEKTSQYFTSTQNISNVLKKLKAYLPEQSTLSDAIVENSPNSETQVDAKPFTITNLELKIHPMQKVILVLEVFGLDGKSIEKKEIELKRLSSIIDSSTLRLYEYNWFNFPYDLDTADEKFSLIYMEDELMAKSPLLADHIKKINYKNTTQMFEEEMDYYTKVRTIAMKEGTGGYDKETGMMTYTLESKNKYWVLLDIFRMQPAVKRETEYSGTIRPEYSCSEYSWTQPKGELFLEIPSSLGYNNCHGEKTSKESCLKDKGEESLTISFDPSQISKLWPRLTFSWKSTCSEWMNTISKLKIKDE